LQDGFFRNPDHPVKTEPQQWSGIHSAVLSKNKTVVSKFSLAGLFQILTGNFQTLADALTTSGNALATFCQNRAAIPAFLPNSHLPSANLPSVISQLPTPICHLPSPNENCS